MKVTNGQKVLGIMFLFVVFSGCFHKGYLGHDISTSVGLYQNNYKIIGRAEGEASEKYVLGLFGGREQNLYARAKRQMVERAKLEGYSRALINVATDETSAYYFVFSRKTVHISCDVIEFIK